MPKSQPPDGSAERRATTRRKADALKISDSTFLRAVLNTSSVFILVLDESGQILVFNRGCEELTGFSAREAVGRHFWEISNAPDQAPQIMAFWRKLQAGHFPECHERHWLTPSGARLIRWSLTKIPAADGGTDYFVAIGFDITEMREAEHQLDLRTAELGERVKELRCLYSISQLSEQIQLSPTEFLARVVELIPPAWQYPDYASASIHLGELAFASPGHADSAVCMSHPLIVNGAEVGAVQVCYRKGHPGGDAPFLPEERNLLVSVAEAAARIVANYESRQHVADYQARLRSLASELAITGERERRRIAQELHNEIGHNLALLKYKLREQAQRQPGEQSSAMLDLLDKTIIASRTITFELSPPVLHELGLSAALEWLSHQLETNYGIRCRFSDDFQPKPLTDELRGELFQAVRELLANIGKHAQANSAAVSIAAVDGEVRILVEDDGAGFDVGRLQRAGPGLGWGLFGTRERLLHLGARMEIDSTPGQGTRVALAAPLVAVTELQNGYSAAAPSPATSPPAARPIRIVLADDQQLTRAGLRLLLSRERDFDVVAEAGTGKEVVVLAKEHNPDVIVMDVAMPELNGIEATRRIISANPEIKVIGLSMHADGQYVLEMLRAGATGYLLKDCAQDDLAQAIRIVQANLTFLSPGLTDNVVSGFIRGKEPPAAAEPAEPAAALTPRELEVLKLLAQGMTTKQAAHELKVSVKTIETHRHHIMEKLSDNSIAGLTRYAIRYGLIELEN